MKTIKIEAYSYSELSDKAKERVQTWLNNDMQLWDKYTQEQWETDLEELGYSNIDIRYSGFYTQGDGASIQCSVEIEKFIKRNRLSRQYASLLYWVRKSENWNTDVKVIRSRNSNYVHEFTLSADSEDLAVNLEEFGASEKAIAQAESIAPLVLQEVRQKSKELYQFLQDDYDYHFTDEFIIDMCESNGYLFDAYGDCVHHLQVDAELQTELR